MIIDAKGAEPKKIGILLADFLLKEKNELAEHLEKRKKGRLN